MTAFQTPEFIFLISIVLIAVGVAIGLEVVWWALSRKARREK